MSLQRLLISLFVLLVIGLSINWFLTNFELQDIEEPIGFQGEAKTNPLLAARLFLKRMGIPAERHDNLNSLPSTLTVLVMDTNRYTLSRKQFNALLMWVEQGGHLITRIRNLDNNTLVSNQDEENVDSLSNHQTDPLLAELGINIGEKVYPTPEDIPLNIKPTNHKKVLAVNPGDFHQILVKQKVYKQELYQDAAWLVEKNWGKGRITILATLKFIENSAIKDYDHAEYLWYLVHSLYTNPQAVWLINQDDLPPLWRLLWNSGWPIILTLLAFIPLNLLVFSRRFGPLLPLPTPNRRRILEHIQASGLFMWQRSQKYQAKPYQVFVNRVKELSSHIRKSHD